MRYKWNFVTICIFCASIRTWWIHWRIYIVKFWPSPRPIFFIFKQFCRKIWSNNRFLSSPHPPTPLRIMIRFCNNESFYVDLCGIAGLWTRKRRILVVRTSNWVIQSLVLENLWWLTNFKLSLSKSKFSHSKNSEPVSTSTQTVSSFTSTSCRNPA